MGRAPVVQTNKLSSSHIPSGTDLIVCAHNHAYITSEVREATRHGAISYHPSLLPRHRGRDAIRWALKMNDAITGGTVYWLDDGVDTGEIAAQTWCWVEAGKTASDLWREQLFPIGVRLLRQVVHNIQEGAIVRCKQNEAVATFEPAFPKTRLAEQ